MKRTTRIEPTWDRNDVQRSCWNRSPIRWSASGCRTRQSYRESDHEEEGKPTIIKGNISFSECFFFSFFSFFFASSFAFVTSNDSCKKKITKMRAIAATTPAAMNGTPYDISPKRPPIAGPRMYAAARKASSWARYFGRSSGVVQSAMYLSIKWSQHKYAWATIQLPANKPVRAREMIREVIFLESPCQIAPILRVIRSEWPYEEPRSERIIIGLRPYLSLTRPMYK